MQCSSPPRCSSQLERITAGKGWFITGAGPEYVATNAIVAVALAAVGGGRYSLDRAIGLHIAGVAWGVAALVTSVVAAAGVLATLRRRPLLTAAPEADSASSAGRA